MITPSVILSEFNNDELSIELLDRAIFSAEAKIKYHADALANMHVKQARRMSERRRVHARLVARARKEGGIS